MIFHRRDRSTLEELAQLRTRLEWLGARHDELRTAYNDLFDFLAGELGFQSKMMPGYYWPEAQDPSNPRRLRMVQETPRVFRSGKDKDDDAATG